MFSAGFVSVSETNPAEKQFSTRSPGAEMVEMPRRGLVRFAYWAYAAEDTTMTTEPNETDGLSRRNLFLGATAALAAGAAISTGSTVRADGTAPRAFPHLDVLGAPITGLAYLPIDGYAFTSGTTLYHDDSSGGGGTGANTNPAVIGAPISLPVGSVIKQINIAYQGTPSVNIIRRPLVTANVPTLVAGPTTLAAGGGLKTQTIDLVPAVTIEQASSYALRFSFTLPGESIYGVTIGYQPPVVAAPPTPTPTPTPAPLGTTFVPFTGAASRIIDTRTPTGGGKFSADEERTYDLGLVGAKFGVFNLAITDTENGGFLAAFAADIAYPGNASINWSTPGSILSNTVISKLDAAGKVKIRCGVNKTHVVIDAIGYFV